MQLMIAVVLMVLLFLRYLRRENRSEHLDTRLRRTELSLKKISDQVHPLDAVLIGPQNIYKVVEDYSRHARGNCCGSTSVPLCSEASLFLMPC
jgi:hypothetical protein